MTTSKRVVLSLLVAAAHPFPGDALLAAGGKQHPQADRIGPLASATDPGFEHPSKILLVCYDFRGLHRPIPCSAAGTDRGPVGGCLRETNAALINIGYWRGLFVYNGQSVQDEKALKRQLAHLLTSLYASKQGTSSNFRL